MLHCVRRLDGLGVPSPINPRDPTTGGGQGGPKSDYVIFESPFISLLFTFKHVTTNIFYVQLKYLLW